MRLVPLVCAVLTMTAGSLHADPIAPAASAVPATSRSVLHKGTIVRLRLETDLRGGESKVGDPVQFTVDRDVFDAHRHLLLAKGTEATGQVTASSAYDSFGRQGRLTFVCHSIRTAGGVSVPLVLVVGSGSGAGADAADASEAQQYNSFTVTPMDPDGYVQSGLGDGYYVQRKGLTVSTIYDPGRLFGGGPEVRADKGEKYTAKVATDTSVTPVPLY